MTQVRPDPLTHIAHDARDDGNEVSLLGLVRIIHRWKPLVAALTIGLPVLTAIVMILTPNKYTATGSILVETPQQGGISSELLGQIGVLAGLPPNISSTDIYSAILKSRRVGTAVVEKLNLSDHFRIKAKEPGARLELTLKALERRVKFDSSDFVTIFISAKDKDPAVAAAIVNAYLDELESANQTLAISRARRTRTLVEESLLGTGAELDSSLKAMQNFQETYGVFAIDKQTEGTLDLIGRLQAELLAAQTERESLEGFSSESSAQLRNLDLRISALKAQIQELVGKLKTALPQVAGMPESVDTEPASGAKGEYFLPLLQLPSLYRDYARLTMNLEVQKAKYTLLATQLEQTKIDESQSIPAFEVLDHAERPYRKSEPKRTLYVLAALASGLLSGVLLAVFLDDVTRRIDPRTRQAVLGLVPGFIRRRWPSFLRVRLATLQSSD